MEKVTILLLVFAFVCIFIILNKSNSNRKLSEGFGYYSTIPSNCVENIHGNIKCYPSYYHVPLSTPWPRYRRYPYQHARGWRRHW